MEQEHECLRTELLALLDRDVASVQEGPERTSFSGLLRNFVRIEFTEDDAANHWKHILDHAKKISRLLGRDVGLHTAVVDYFTNIKHCMHSPILVESVELRQTEQLAMVDGLTGVFNRRYMDLMLKKEFNRCSRYNKALSVCLIDLDDFKHLNDSQGHAFGDLVLKQISTLIKEALREEDIVCRYGGEEFLIILPETDTVGAAVLASRIRQKMKLSLFFSENNISFSAGIASYPESTHEFPDLVKSADMALYQAKFSGKDRIEAAPRERRRFGRHSHSWNLDIYQMESSSPLAGVSTMNVSIGGIQFGSPVKFNLDTPLHLVFTNIDATVPLLEADGKISWIKKKNRNYLYGVNFSETPELIQSRLNVESGT